MYQHKNNDFTQFELGINLFYNEEWFVWKPPSINRKNIVCNFTHCKAEETQAKQSEIRYRFIYAIAKIRLIDSYRYLLGTKNMSFYIFWELLSIKICI